MIQFVLIFILIKKRQLVFPLVRFFLLHPFGFIGIVLLPIPIAIAEDIPCRLNHVGLIRLDFLQVLYCLVRDRASTAACPSQPINLVSIRVSDAIVILVPGFIRVCHIVQRAETILPGARLREAQRGIVFARDRTHPSLCPALPGDDHLVTFLHPVGQLLFAVVTAFGTNFKPRRI